MAREQLLARLTQVIVEYVGIDPDKVHESAKLEDDLGLDSLDRVELMMGVEDELNIEVGDDEVRGLTTVGDALNLIEAKLA